ncbi:MAG: GNAT family N-acetyltransferase [Devosia sp.]
MSDLLVRLYDLPVFEAEAKLKAAGISVRRTLPPERQIILDWVATKFSSLWASEVALGMSQQPPSVYVAVRNAALIGFACYDTTAKGFFGPTGVDEVARGQGIGEALLISTLKAMREAGYAYAVIGDPGPVAFYKKRLDALDIPKSKPGIYAGMLTTPQG